MMKVLLKSWTNCVILLKRGVDTGDFYSTVQIYDNEKLGRNGFIEKFCKKMADEGYVSCGGDEA